MLRYVALTIDNYHCIPGALTDFMKSMLELTNDKMPDVVVHEYSPLLDSSDMGPPDWQVIAKGECCCDVCTL